MILIINTADVEEIYVALVEKGEVVAKKIIKAKYKQAEKLLPVIFELVGRKVNFSSPLSISPLPRRGEKVIKGIAVVTGPGSFSALRVGICVANTLGWALKIPVAGVRLNEFKNKESQITQMAPPADGTDNLFEIEKLVAVAEQRLRKTKVGNIVVPHYGREPRITMKI